MSHKLLTLTVRAQHGLQARLQDRREAGQGTLEYVGMIVLVFNAIKGTNMDTKVKDAITSVLDLK